MNAIYETIPAYVIQKRLLMGFTEVTLEIKIVDDNTAFMKIIDNMQGVQSCSLVNYTDDYAQ
jgi:hypothetical protein